MLKTDVYLVLGGFHLCWMNAWQIKGITRELKEQTDENKKQFGSWRRQHGNYEVGRLHRKVFRMKNLMFDLRTIPLYRPTAAVYNYNQEMKKVLIKDFESMVRIQNGIKRAN